MTPNFALSMSADGLTLMHRTGDGWAMVDTIALTEADLDGAMANLRQAALARAPDGIFTKLLIPNDQIKYLAMDSTQVEETDIRAELDGATPYKLDELTFDYSKGGGRTYIAAVANETLREAETFAQEHGLNPVCFAAMPEPFTYVGEAFFGPVDGFEAARDEEAVPLATVQVEAASAPPIRPSQEPPDTPPQSPARATGAKSSAEGRSENARPSDAPSLAAPTPQPDRPAAEAATPALSVTLDAIKPIASAANGKIVENDLAVQRPASTPPHTNDAQSAQRPAPLTAYTPDPAGSAPAITGQPSNGAQTHPQAPTPSRTGLFRSRRKTRAEATASAVIDPREAEKSRMTIFGARKPPKAKSAVVGGKPRFLGLILTAILLLFLLAVAAMAAFSDGTLARWFGWGGNEVQTAATQEMPEIEAAQPINVSAVPSDQGAASEVAADAQIATDASSFDQPNIGDEQSTISPNDTLASSELENQGVVLSPEEAQRIYAATGVWQRAPRIPIEPRFSDLEGLALASALQTVTRTPPSPLTDPDVTSSDVLFPTPVDPPPPTAIFEFGPDGFVIATPNGAITPDGTLVYAGRPALEPPVRPGTIAPEVSPQELLASLRPTQTDDSPQEIDGAIVISGRPKITPPIRPGTESPIVPTQEPDVLLSEDGLIVFARAPDLLPPARPAPEAPSTPVATEAEPNASANISDPAAALAADIAAALENQGQQSTEVFPVESPDASTPRPNDRPENIVEAATTPILGELTRLQAAALRPQTRPDDIAPPSTASATPEPVQAEATQSAALDLAPAITAALEAANTRPNTLVNVTAQAVPASLRPDSRPRNMDRIVDRAQQAQARAATQVAAAPSIAPSGPTAGSVAQAATLENAINLREINLIGVFGNESERRALVRLGNGRFVRVTVGDRLDGGRVNAISANALTYTKRGRSITLNMGG